MSEVGSDEEGELEKLIQQELDKTSDETDLDYDKIDEFRNIMDNDLNDLQNHSLE
ncbi:hypothetical protein HK096_011097, partial [Nowakowskiella sp. JEL0078]